MDNFFHHFKIRIAVPAIKIYHKAGAKGGLGTGFLLRGRNIFGSLEAVYRPSFAQKDFDRGGKGVFQKALQVVLQSEILRFFTLKKLKKAKENFERLTDERIGRLFRASGNVEVTGVSGSPELAFKISDRDYNIKTELFNRFLTELYESSKDYVSSNFHLFFKLEQ
jgi:hypothetical protein